MFCGTRYNISLQNVLEKKSHKMEILQKCKVPQIYTEVGYTWINLVIYSISVDGALIMHNVMSPDLSMFTFSSQLKMFDAQIWLER